MATIQKITPCLWFDMQAEEAMNYYCSVFPDSRIIHVEKYPDESLDEHFVGMTGKVITGIFELHGQRFICLDGGKPDEHLFSFNNAVSFEIQCKDQAEVDRYWDKLSAVPEGEQCGWCTDKFGVRWQIIPENMGELLSSPAAMQAMMQMKKIDIATLQTAGRE